MNITYRGSASVASMKKIKTEFAYMPTPEGKVMNVEPKGPVSDVLKSIKDGLRSSFSYSNAKNIQEFHKNSKYEIKHSK